MFLDITDYDQTITPNILQQLIDGNDDNRLKAELNAQSIMEDHLRQRYDVTAVFSATGSARNKSVLKYMLDIVMYFLHRRKAPNSIPQTRTDDYGEAIKWLEKVQKGTASPDLPLLIDTSTNAPRKRTFVGSKKEREDLDF